MNSEHEFKGNQSLQEVIEELLRELMSFGVFMCKEDGLNKD